MYASTGIRSNIVNIILKNGPANIMLALWRSVFSPKARGSFDSPSSPSILTYPPRGKSLTEYFVSPFWVLYILGPIPIANSCILTPAFFANRKCPSSCINTIIPNSIIAAIIVKF